MAKVNKIIPKSPREVEQFYRDIIPKVSGTDTTLSDEEQKSSIPFLGITQSLQRQIDTIARDVRNNKAERGRIERLETENRRMKAEIAQLSARLKDIEGEL